ncbi:MAG TPA: sodium:solute symporter, partial [Acidobacteria bacterium]|nr:sodium:solute symporter [Acidobacteriota bacterium]
LRTEASDRHYLFVSKLTTAFWGVFATIFALYAANLGSLIEVVNRVGSYFYGSLLGVFVLAIGFRRASANGAFWGLLAGMVAVGLVEVNSDISYIWYNVVGSITVVAVGLAVSVFQSAQHAERQ